MLKNQTRGQWQSRPASRASSHMYVCTHSMCVNVCVRKARVHMYTLTRVTLPSHCAECWTGGRDASFPLRTMTVGFRAGSRTHAQNVSCSSHTFWGKTSFMYSLHEIIMKPVLLLSPTTCAARKLDWRASERTDAHIPICTLTHANLHFNTCQSAL